jgi:hypothetical protein
MNLNLIRRRKKVLIEFFPRFPHIPDADVMAYLIAIVVIFRVLAKIYPIPGRWVRHAALAFCLTLLASFYSSSGSGYNNGFARASGIVRGLMAFDISAAVSDMPSIIYRCRIMRIRIERIHIDRGFFCAGGAQY